MAYNFTGISSNIINTNPNLVANKSFVNAVFMNAYGRNATAAELTRFAGKTVSQVGTGVYGTQYQTALTKLQSGKTPTTTTTALAGPKVPDELANNPYFKQLDPDSQALIAYNWSLLASQNTDKIAAFQSALTEAGKQADPYWAEKINIMKDELSRSLGSLDTDLASRQADLTRRRDYIQSQLTSGSANITAEQQAELARQSQQYDTEIHSIGEEMANRGVTFSTINERARSKAAESNTGVVESINRTAANELNKLQTGSQADLADIAAQLTTLQQAALAQKTSLIRGTEATIGSGALGDLSGGLGMGGITGSLSEAKAADIMTRAQTLAATR